jgi:hypothetical protein
MVLSFYPQVTVIDPVVFTVPRLTVNGLLSALQWFLMWTFWNFTPLVDAAYLRKVYIEEDSHVLVLRPHQTVVVYGTCFVLCFLYVVFALVVFRPVAQCFEFSDLTEGERNALCNLHKANPDLHAHVLIYCEKHKVTTGGVYHAIRQVRRQRRQYRMRKERDERRRVSDKERSQLRAKQRLAKYSVPQGGFLSEATVWSLFRYLFGTGVLVSLVGAYQGRDKLVTIFERYYQKIRGAQPEMSQFLVYPDLTAWKIYAVELATSASWIQNVGNVRRFRLTKLILAFSSYFVSVQISPGLKYVAIKVSDFIEHYFPGGSDQASPGNLAWGVISAIVGVCTIGSDYLLNDGTSLMELGHKVDDVIARPLVTWTDYLVSGGETSPPYTASDKILELLNFRKMLSKIHAGSLNSSNDALLRGINARITDALEFLEASIGNSTSRVTPFAIMLYGEPGAGKSFLIPELIPGLQSSMGLLVGSEYVFERNMTGTDEYWETYTSSHNTVVMEEVASGNPNIPASNMAMMEFTSLISSNPHHLNMAFESKGKVLFDSPLIIGTTNKRDLNAHHYATSPEAVLRRFIFVEVANSTNLTESDDIITTGYTFKVFRWQKPYKVPTLILETNSVSRLSVTLRDMARTHISREVAKLRALRGESRCPHCGLTRLCDCPCQQSWELKLVGAAVGITSIAVLVRMFLFVQHSETAVDGVVREIRHVTQSANSTFRSVTDLAEQFTFSRTRVHTLFENTLAATRRSLLRVKQLIVQSKGEVTEVLASLISTESLLLGSVALGALFAARTLAISRSDSPQADTHQLSFASYHKAMRPRWARDGRNFSIPVHSGLIPVKRGVSLHDLLDALATCTVYCVIKTKGHIYTTRGVFIVPHVLLINRHFVVGEILEISLTYLRVTSGVTPSVTVTVGPEHTFDLEGFDLSCVYLPTVSPRGGKFRTLVQKHFTTLSQRCAAYRTDLVMEDDGAVNMSAEPCFIGGMYENPSFVVAGSRFYETTHTGQGMCGSLYILNTGSGFCVVGHHCAGNPVLGYATPIYQGLITQAVKKAQHVFGYYCDSKPTPQGLDLAQLKPVDVMSEFWGCDDVIGTVLGTAPSTGMSLNSRLRPTRYSEYFVPHYPPTHTIPNFRGRMEANGASFQWKSPINTSYSGMCYRYHDYTRVNYLRRFYLKLISKRLENIRFDPRVTRPISAVESVFGIPGVDYFDHMNNDTSAGWPLRGVKREYINVEEQTLSPEIQDSLTRMLERYRRGQLCSPVFKLALKDEPITFEKQKRAKVRVFACSPFAYNIIFRMYYLPVIAMIMDCRFIFGIAVGMNAASSEWLALFNYLTFDGEITHRVVAGDYSSFDKNMGSDFIYGAFEFMIDLAIKYLTYTDEDVRVMRSLAFDTIHHWTMYMGDFVLMSSTNPSGQPATAILNSIVNQLYILHVVLEMYPKATTDQLAGGLRAMVYGDDNILSLHPSIGDLRHHDMVEHMKSIGQVFSEGLSPHLSSVCLLPWRVRASKRAFTPYWCAEVLLHLR